MNFCIRDDRAGAPARERWIIVADLMEIFHFSRSRGPGFPSVDAAGRRIAHGDALLTA